MKQVNNSVVDPVIIFENENYLILDKPAGWVVNSATTVKNGFIIQEWLKDNFDYEIAKSFDKRSGIVHRLDKDTSGILIVAKTNRYFEYLQGEFKSRKISKEYIALVHGITESEGKIIKTVGRLPWNRERFGVMPGGRDAQTDYIREAVLKLNNNSYSLVRCFPKTGRTHQIRIHLKSINHPIVSDRFYAGRKTSRNDLLFCPRLFLHACLIRFNDMAGNIVSYEAKLPGDLSEVLSKMDRV